MNVFHRKIYALIQSGAITIPSDHLACLSEHLTDLDHWWTTQGNLATQIAQPKLLKELGIRSTAPLQQQIEIRHPISGQSHQIPPIDWQTAWEDITPPSVLTETNPQKVFTWLWRFYPEKLCQKYPSAYLYPSDRHTPDSPIHSYGSTVSAITGALFPDHWQPNTAPKRPYILLFTFSPVQEFVKASRKLLDFWAGSYTLHYLSAWLCWQVATELGADSILTPSLWSQPIIDAFLYQAKTDLLPNCPETLAQLSQIMDEPSLRVAGFPNYMTVIVSGKDEAIAWQQKLETALKKRWLQLGRGVRQCIKGNVRTYLGEYLSEGDRRETVYAEICEQPTDRCDLELLQQGEGGAWQWNALWEAQLHHTWESYNAAIPLGHPDFPLEISLNDEQLTEWIAAQETITQSRQPTINLEQIRQSYAHKYTANSPSSTNPATTINVGIWWAKTLARLARTIQESKNTRHWAIPVAPGKRSSISGLFSAVHPHFLYRDRFREGGGLSEGTQRLFWRLLAKVFVGIFDGSEHLNAIELTKRMAWCYGDLSMAITLGIKVDTQASELDYEQIVRFPNLSSIAAARFGYDAPQTIYAYWKHLEKSFPRLFPDLRDRFYSRTRGRPFHVPKVDAHLNPQSNNGRDFNGVMFSGKWLAEDCGLTERSEIAELRSLVSEAHKTIGAGEQSPADWWALVYGDGDSMGQYVSGRNLLTSDHYIASDVKESLAATPEIIEHLRQQKKRMGATTQANLNRALLDFSNRLVPMLAEQRFCGKVVYSGGDDVMVALPLADLAPFLVSLRAAWSGSADPQGEFISQGGYWYAKDGNKPPFFTMGEGATMSCGVVIANKGVPLATVLNHIWEAEKDRAKKVYQKDGLCFRVVYGSGNVLEAILKGSLLADWEKFLNLAIAEDLSPVLYRLAEELPRHAMLDPRFFTERHENDSEPVYEPVYEPTRSLLWNASVVIIASRDREVSPTAKTAFLDWLTAWEQWAIQASLANHEQKTSFGATPEDLSILLRFTAFMCDRAIAPKKWQEKCQAEPQGVRS
ncbi:MAG: type III-B CRISPR-associated protein Cas10/Cmr2 [Pseudanabaena sp. ELA645]|jgi:CRISPR-associated protein Cmr2